MTFNSIRNSRKQPAICRTEIRYVTQAIRRTRPEAMKWRGRESKESGLIQREAAGGTADFGSSAQRLFRVLRYRGRAGWEGDAGRYGGWRLLKKNRERRDATSEHGAEHTGRAEGRRGTIVSGSRRRALMHGGSGRSSIRACTGRRRGRVGVAARGARSGTS